MIRQRRPRLKNERHLRAIRQLPCILCGAEAEAAHVRYGSLDHDKRPSGIGERPDDRWTVPLCPQHHRHGARSQHAGNELEWWRGHNLDPLAAAAALSAVSPDVIEMHEAMKPFGRV